MKTISRRIKVAAPFLSLLSILSGADPPNQRIDAMFSRFTPATPGCALGVIQDGVFVYRRGYGLASLELGVPLTSASVFYMGSVSKQFTAAAVVLAAEQGKLSLDDNIRRYIPELPDYGAPITLRQMLHHTSGLRDIFQLLFLAGRDPADIHPTDELMDLVTRQKSLDFQPGAEYSYSNTNFFLAGQVIRRVTGQSFSAFTEANIFRPLGMTHTHFHDDRTAIVPGRVAGYSPRGSAFRVDWSLNFEKVGDGGLMSSVDDMLLWDRNFYQNRLGKGTLLKELQTRGTLNDGRKIGYALGLEIGEYRGLPTVAHGGDLFGYRTEILRFPEQRFSVVCLCNLSDADPADLASRVADAYLESRMKPAVKASSAPSGASSAATLAGRYYDPTAHRLIVLSGRDGALFYEDQTYRPAAANRFESGLNTMVFDGPRLTITQPDATVFRGARAPDNQPVESALETYTGLYRCPELDAVYTVRVDSGSLVYRAGWNPPVRLVPTVPGEFHGPDIDLAFHRDSSGKVTGFAAYSGRVRGITFQKSN